MKIIAPVIVVLGVIAWYLFRPELLFIRTTVNEKLPETTAQQAAAPSSAPVALFAGRFHGVAHQTSGVATVYQLADGKRLLRFTEFETSNGPDVHVYLVAAPDAKDNETVKRAGFLPLGPMKGTRGDQNYELPADADLTKYRAVTIWCRRFGVNFATAPLRLAQKT
jgi:hypothetical protein